MSDAREEKVHEKRSKPSPGLSLVVDYGPSQPQIGDPGLLVRGSVGNMCLKDRVLHRINSKKG